jgi:hypothetical protein
MQGVFLPGPSIELILDAVERESAIGDPIGEPPGHGPEMRRVIEVILDRIQSEHHALRAIRRRRHKITQHRAP